MEPNPAPFQQSIGPRDLLRKLLGLHGLPPEIGCDIRAALGEGELPALPEALVERRLRVIGERLLALGHLRISGEDSELIHYEPTRGPSFLFALAREEPKVKISLPFAGAAQLSPAASAWVLTHAYRELVGRDNTPLVRLADALELLRAAVKRLTGAEHVTISLPSGSRDRRLVEELGEMVRPYDTALVEDDVLRRRCLVALADINVRAPSPWGGLWRSLAILPLWLPPSTRGGGVLLAVHAWSPWALHWSDERLAALALLAEAVPDLLRHMTTLDDLAFMEPDIPLYNRRYLDHQLPVEVARAGRLRRAIAFCILDLDDLKSINERHLHHGGDAAIRYVADHLEKVLRRSSDWVARRGRGDEFAFVLVSEKSGEPAEEFVKVARVIAEFLRQTIANDKCPMPGAPSEGERVTVSIGGAVLPGQVADVKSLSEAAERALNEAKALGKNRVVIYGPERVR